MRVLVLVLLAGCLASPTYDGTMYKCDLDPICPEGFTCTAGVCTAMPVEGDVAVFPTFKFTMGCNAADVGCSANWTRHDVTVSGFVIQKHEAPMHGVSWQAASDYCASIGMRLPYEAEWERAARAGDAPYPWGSSTIDCTYAHYNNCTSGVVDTVPVKDDAASGIRNLAGNAREWVTDYWDDNYYATSPPTDPHGPPANGQRVTRGGSYKSNAGEVTVWHRQPEDPLHTNDELGIRCARSM